MLMDIITHVINCLVYLQSIYDIHFLNLKHCYIMIKFVINVLLRGRLQVRILPGSPGLSMRQNEAVKGAKDLRNLSVYAEMA